MLSLSLLPPLVSAYRVVTTTSQYRAFNILWNRVGYRSLILLNQIVICRGEIDTNLGIFVDVKY